MYAHKRQNISTSFFNLGDNYFAKVKLNWLTHTCVHREFNGKDKKKNIVLLLNITLRLTLITCILWDVPVPLSIFWKVLTILLTNI